MDLMDWVFLIVFIDDILIYSKIREAYEQNLWTTLQTLPKHKLYPKFNNSELWLEMVAFLGHIISENGI